ncbi:hypothetical protein CH252_04020 [Rhodococcus sp. 06-1477-1B]|nr:hypothetical protein CH252_04020 [Rhodococcus sp. 06-1477-1B]
MNLGAALTLATCVVCMIVVLRGPRETAAARAVAGSIVLAALVPVMSIVDRASSTTAMLTVILLCTTALLRRGVSPERGTLWGVALFAMFGGWMILRTLGQFSTDSTVLIVTMISTAIAVAMVVPHLRPEDLPALATVFLVLTLLLTLYAVAEQFGAVDAIWQLRQSSLQNIDDRANVLLPMLAGRSQASFGHPIPFAVFLSVACLMLLHSAIETRRWRFAFGAIAAVAGLLLSGTRSAVVALLAALLIYLIANIRWRRLLAIAAGAGVLSIAALLTDLPKLLSLDNTFESSVSFVHRTLVADSWASLWSQSATQLWIGAGAGATAELFRSGIVRGARNLTYFDNTYISLFALFGLIALGLLCAVFLWSVRGGALAMSMTAFLVVMGFSFDEQQWQITLVLLAFSALMPRAFGSLSRRHSATAVPASGSMTAMSERSRPRTMTAADSA